MTNPKKIAEGDKVRAAVFEIVMSHRRANLTAPDLSTLEICGVLKARGIYRSERLINEYRNDLPPFPLAEALDISRQLDDEV